MEHQQKLTDRYTAPPARTGKTDHQGHAGPADHESRRLASPRRPKAVLTGLALVIAVLGVLGLRVEGHLTQSLLVVPGTESDRAIRLARAEFGQSVTVPILLQGPAAEINRQGSELVTTLSRRADHRRSARSAIRRPCSGARYGAAKARQRGCRRGAALDGSR